MTVTRALGVTQTKTEITGLVPQSCYNIDVYTVSFSEISHNSRSFTNVCTQTPLDPNFYTVIYGESSFTIFWVNFSDKYHVNVSCNYLSQVFSLNKPSLSVNGTIPGDCCVLNVKNWNYTISRQYFVHVNETLPENPVVISNITTRTHLNLTWKEPMRSNGWIHGYTIDLFDSKDTIIENYTVSCIQPEPKCRRNGSYWKYQCSSFSLVNNRNANIYYTNSRFHISIGGFKPGMLYHYSITAINKAGSNTTDRIPVITQEDKPESPASLDIAVLNVTTMSITWSPPNVTNGVITEYNVSYCSNGIRGCKYTVVEGMTSVTLRNLDCWKEFLVCVSALTLAGAGPQKCGVENTSVYEPRSKISKITSSNTTITLEFEVPCDSREAPISYDIAYTSLNHSCSGDQTNVTSWWECFPLRPCKITGLFSYWDYFIKVQESVEHIVGEWSNEHKVSTLQSFPEEVRNVRAQNIKSDSMTVCWEKPCFLNSDRVFYNVTLNDDPYVNVYRFGAILQTECQEFADLLPYTNYTISVTASNQFGKADPVGIIKQTDIAVPNQPRFSGIEEHATMMTVEWKPPDPYPGPTSYTVKVRDIENSETKNCQALVYNQTKCSVFGLEEYWQYEVTITAHTERGTKQYKHSRYIQTKQSAPGPVTHLRVNHKNDIEKSHLVVIKFGPPVYRDRNGVIKAYYVRCHDTRTYRDIHFVKLNKNLTELEMTVPDQVLLNISVFAETIENGTEVYQTIFIPAGETNTPLVSSVSSVPLVLAVIGWTLAVVLAGTTVFYKRQLHSQQSNTPVTSNANIIELSGAYDRSDYINADATKDTDGHYESIE
ncbi:tyrosine-protein phosphatase Lar-like [Mytilus edulis]|uniref:tyrosine-protein phosphatase Lar-like n=1 Tax=Mytilus edulis TaxID=6550 RepID=UPI0039EEDF4A